MTMNRNQILDLLSVIVSYDNRAADDATIATFMDAAQHGRWTHEEAIRAARDWLNDNPDGWLRPGHITQLIRARRRDAMALAAVPRHTPDPELLRRLEAFADSKAVDNMDARRPAKALPSPRHVPHGERVVAEAMRRGEAKRAAALEQGSSS